MGFIVNPTTGQLDFVGTGGGGGSPGPAQRYTQTFDSTTSWGSPAAGEYSLLVAAATHGRGSNPTIQIFESVLGNLDKVEPNSITVDNVGNVTITTLENPDTRFSGLIVII